ncbi:MAG: AbrB/MazE/SpoVT family DNA-binding domain-containing protein [Nanoarchaeota archaeon]
MKRKVIQIANSTMLVSIPRKWAQKYGVKKGDEIEVEENGNKLVIGADAGVELKNIEVDITGLNRTMIIYYIQNLYRCGYDEIKVIFNSPVVKYLRKNEEVSVISILHKEANRLLGYEIIQQKDNFVIIRDISTSSIKEFDTVLRRIFLLINDVSSDLLKGMSENNKPLLQTIEEKHDSITKFISYCLRLLNKYGYPDHRKTSMFYHILATLDRSVDVFKYAARDILALKKGVSPKTVNLYKMIDEEVKLLHQFFFNFDTKKVDELYTKRNEFLSSLNGQKSKMSADDILLISKLSLVMELFLEIEVSRMGVEGPISG